jgi:opacity protein-like surface antigen
MKKGALIVLLLVLVASICCAQDTIGKGAVEISANFTGSTFGVSTIPAIGYFLTDSIELSGAFHYETGSIDDADYDAHGLSLLGLYNFYPESIERLIPFVEVGFNIASLEIEGFDVVDSTGFVIGGGVRYLITDNFSVNAILNYQTGDLEYTRFGIGVSVFIF